LDANYIMEYILVETQKSYIWITFTATKETFDVNYDKFTEFISTFELIE